MQISKINNQSFGANPCAITRHLLIDLEKNNIDTTNIMRVMKDIFVKGTIKSKHTPRNDGSIMVGLFSEQGDFLHFLISPSDKVIVNEGNLALKEPGFFAKKLFNALKESEANRTPGQKAFDKVHGFFA